MPRAARSLSVLRKDIEKLRDQLLPEKFDPANNYKNARVVQARTRAFLVLAHAEFECYIEEWASELVKAAHVVWKKSSRIVGPLHFLIATHPKPFPVPAKLPLGSTDDIPTKFKTQLETVVADYLTLVNDNHGIKEANIAALVARLGVPTSVFGTTLIPALTAYGDRRGKHVHNSAARAAVLLVLDPQDEYARAINMITELQPLHAWFIASKKKIR